MQRIHGAFTCFARSGLIITFRRKPHVRQIQSKSPNRDQIEPNSNFFRYTSGRWLLDEQKQLERRYIQFDIAALQQTAAQICGSQCVQMTMLPEGLFNKVFSLRMENGTEVLARIPNPNAGDPRSVVASEFATLDFLRDVLDIPVPKVMGSSSLLRQNPVGAEYILMERVKGRQLSDVWDTMSEAQRFGLVKSLVEIERRLASTTFAGYGSLYQKDTIPSSKSMAALVEVDQGATREFVLGPTTERSFWEDEKRELEIDRGPWKTAQEYIAAVANREIALVQRLATSRPKTDPRSLSGTSMSCERHVQILEQFLLVLPYILPSRDLVGPVLLHHDLHSENIFVDDADPTKLSRIIDWQSLYSSPLFMQARLPSVFDSDDEPYPWGAVQPQLPTDFHTLSPSNQKLAEAQLNRLRLKKFYELATRKFNPRLTRAMDFTRRDDDPTAFLFHIVGQSSIDGPVPLQELLVQIFESWDLITKQRGVPCPISFSREGIDRIRQQAEAWAEAYAEFDSFRTQILGHDGWVSHDDYEEAMGRWKDGRAELEALRKRLEGFL